MTHTVEQLKEKGFEITMNWRDRDFKTEKQFSLRLPNGHEMRGRFGSVKEAAAYANKYLELATRNHGAHRCSR